MTNPTGGDEGKHYCTLSFSTLIKNYEKLQSTVVYLKLEALQALLLQLRRVSFYYYSFL
jgi:hypothetical protein